MYAHLINDRKRRLSVIKDIQKKSKRQKASTFNRLVKVAVVSTIILCGILSTSAIAGAPEDPEPARTANQGLTSVHATVTAYSEIDSCHYENCIMASGKRAYIGAIACPRDIKLGTKVIVGDTTYTCEDRTNKSLDGRYDIFVGYGKSAYKNALEFGKQLKEVHILE